MYKKIFLVLLAVNMITVSGLADTTEETYSPIILPDNPLYNFIIAFENWQIEHEYLIFPDTNETSKINKRLAFIERRLIDTQKMIDNNVNFHAINNSIEHMNIALMKLNGSTKEEIKTFKKEVSDMQTVMKGKK